MKCKVLHENKEIYVFGFKPIKTDKLDHYILIGCESVKIFENNKQFIFWCNIFKKER